MNNCNCNGLLPLIFGYLTGRNSQNNCCNCDQNVMPINDFCPNGNMNSCWLVILLLLFCCCGSNNCSCNN